MNKKPYRGMSQRRMPLGRTESHPKRMRGFLITLKKRFWNDYELEVEDFTDIVWCSRVRSVKTFVGRAV